MTDEEFTERAVEATTDILEFLSTRVTTDGLTVGEMQLSRASQAVALLCASDMLLATLPVEVAFEYRQAAKKFSHRLEEMWDAEDQPQKEGA